MSRAPRYRLQKDLNQPEIVRALEAVGCSVIVMHTPCDLLVGRTTPQGPRNYLLEVKNPDKSPAQRKLTPTQVKLRTTWKGQFAVVDSPALALAAVGIDRF